MMIKKNTCLVLGAQSQIAQALHQQVHLYRDDHFVFLNKRQADLMDAESLRTAIEFHQPKIIINCAAYTNVDDAERDVELAHAVNFRGVQTLAALCSEYSICLIHLSTDYVFSGEHHCPYVETDAVSPLNMYGKSKASGDEAIRALLPQHIILRVSAVYSEFGRNFLKTMLNVFQEKEAVSVVDDQVVCPTSARSVAKALYVMASQPRYFGTYHFCGQQALSWYQFARFIHETYQRRLLFKVQSISPISSKEYNALAFRPRYSALNCKKILMHYAIAAPCLYADFHQLKERIVA